MFASLHIRRVTVLLPERDVYKRQKYRQAYLHAFERMLNVRRAKGLQTDLWHNAEDVMRWWLEDPNVEGQMTMEELIAEGSGEA